MTYTRFLPVLMLALALGAGGAELPKAKPESVGMSGERLERIGVWLTGLSERKEAAGFVALVARRGKVVLHQSYGKRGLDTPEAMPLDALFDLASMTKPFTCVAAVTLLEEGRFALKDPIANYLPEFKNMRVEVAPGRLEPAGRPITVEHLFTHSSGVYNTMSRHDMFRLGTLKAFMGELARQPLRAEPGTTWLYGTSHEVLGYLVEQVSGVSLERYIRERILAPLELKDTHYWPPAETDKRRAVLVVNGKDDPTSASRVPPEAAQAKTYAGGQSGLYSTAGDYGRFAQMLANGGTLDGKRILSPKTVTFIAQDHTGDLKGLDIAGTHFGLGFAVVTEPGRAGMPYSKGTYYWSGSQGTLFWIDPAEQLVAVLMVQRVPNVADLREKFSAMVYASIVE